MKKQIILTMCAAAALSSCHIYKAYDRPESIDASGIYRDPVSATDTLAADTANMGNLPWKEVFKDVKLQALIEEGLANNVDMQAAVLRVKEAKVMLTSARLSYLPSINLAPQGTMTTRGGSDMSKAYQLPLAASWEIDLFGKILNAKRGQQAMYLQSQYAQQAVRSQIICGIANVYYTLLMLDRQVEITTETAAIYKENVRAMEAMKLAGYVNEAAVTQMRAASHQVEASLLDLKRQVRETENSLAVLLAKAPQTIERGRLADQVMPDELTAGVPLQLLENRPDVKIAEMTLASAYYTTNQARSAFYPSIVLNGTAGWTNSAGSLIVDPAKLILTAVGQLTMPLFNRGQNIANLRIAKAQQEQAKLSFQQTLLSAGTEVNDALTVYQTCREKTELYQKQVDALETALKSTTLLMDYGTANYLEVLTARQSLLNAKLAQVSNRFSEIQSVISLYQALGGGR